MTAAARQEAHDVQMPRVNTMIRRKLPRALLVLLLSVVLLTTGDALRLNPAERVAAPYLYSVAQWEAGNFLSKWVHRLSRALPWNSLSREERRQRVRDFFALGEMYRRLESQKERLAAEGGPDTAQRVMEVERGAAAIGSKRRRLRDDVEELLESAISSVARDEGLGLWLGLIWPPVDFRLSDPPKVLVTSPRDRIARTHSVLLRSGVTVARSEEMEARILKEQDLAALVTGIGGLATYPASIENDQSLRATLELAAHEWLHHYFAFRPLGWYMFESDDMQVLNETVANLVAKELSERALSVLGLEPEHHESGAGAPAGSAVAAGEQRFDFFREMRATRLRVDALLGEGKIEEAESYMEERRRSFADNGVYIRKLNQAYFAFNGTYGDSPASVSPVAGQLRELRLLVPDLGDFISAVAHLSSYQRFLELLENLKARSKAGIVDGD